MALWDLGFRHKVEEIAREIAELVRPPKAA